MLCLLPIYSWESQTCENCQTIWFQWDVYFLFFLYYLKRLPEQIKVKHEKMKEEMIGMCWKKFWCLSQGTCTCWILCALRVPCNNNEHHVQVDILPKSSNSFPIFGKFQRFGVVWVMTQVQVQHRHVCQGRVIFWNVVLCMLEKNYMQLMVFV